MRLPHGALALTAAIVRKLASRAPLPRQLCAFGIAAFLHVHTWCCPYCNVSLCAGIEHIVTLRDWRRWTLLAFALGRAKAHVCRTRRCCQQSKCDGTGHVRVTRPLQHVPVHARPQRYKAKHAYVARSHGLRDPRAPRQAKQYSSGQVRGRRCRRKRDEA